MDTIATKVESLLEWLKPGTNKDENVIDLQKTFSATGIDILPLVIKILELEAEFPTSRIKTPDGIKYHELEFFEANISSSNQTNKEPQQNQESLFTRLDRTYTTLGSTLLKSMILQPYHTQQQIKNIVINRQNIILELISNSKTNPNAFMQIQMTLEGLQKIEQELLVMSLEDTPEMEEVYKIIFFEIGPFKYLNYNSLFLKIFYYFMIIFSPLYGMIAPFIFIFAPFLFMKYILKIPIPLDTFLNIMKKMLFGGTGFMTMLDKMFNSQFGAGMQSNLFSDGISIKGVVFWLVRMAISILNSNLGGYAYVAFIVVSYLYGIYNSLQVSITFNKIINMFHSRMNILAKWLRGCIQLYKMNVCFNATELTPILAHIESLLGNELVQMLLENEVFIKEPGLISDKGIIIKCFRLFLDAKKEGRDIIAPFARYLAYVDVFMALGTWLREQDDRCPATFILDSNYPIIQGTDLWNLACKQPIYNNVSLGNVSLEDISLEIDSLENTAIGDIVLDDNNDNMLDKNTSSDLEESNSQESRQQEAIDYTISSNNIDSSNIEEEFSQKEDKLEELEKLDELDKQNKTNYEKIEETSKSNNTIKEFQNTSSSDNEEKNNNTNCQKSIKTEIKNTKDIINNIIITGPNGSGKSTYIKSITECVILAQTVGLVPAREFSLTPFTHISTYLNIPDCQGKESLFQAEMNRCYQQLETLRTAEKAGEFSFNIMDEIFVSTNYQEGMSGAYAVINQLCRFNKCLNIITTHFDKLANLEDLQISRKYFDIELGEDGQVSRDYKIRDGVSRKHMALKLLRNRGFSEELVKDAERFYTKISYT